ncbi:hypothetical protein Nepgr_016733 [Nepenthes gracilis]|uniref:rRNA adenine N(6)-methyltransferase n=1 Tax=Nepenthes gracilis TaxID=150966 RepID=A0AAD3XRK1_NEPGR|nr:hypothetical protein Nepgr_016733 [Nepenthes gracilis]
MNVNILDIKVKDEGFYHNVSTDITKIRLRCTITSNNKGRCNPQGALTASVSINISSSIGLKLKLFLLVAIICGKISMLRQHKSLSLPSTVFVFSCQSLLRELHTKPNHHNFDKHAGQVHNKEINSDGRLYLYRSKGQHLLTNSRVLDSIVRNSNIRSTDTVLEIGPGTGNLTLKLLEAAHKVVAVEVDKRMVEILQKRVAEHGFEDRMIVICKDALKAKFPPFDLVVANIPYGISSPLVAKLVFGETPFRSATLLLQKEFARRLLAKPGDSEFNRLAVNIKLVAEVEFVMDISKRDFLPIPKVDSSVVQIRPKAEIQSVDLPEWWAFTRTCFSKKNKTLGATFKQKKKVMELMRMSVADGLNNENVARDYTSDLRDEDRCNEEEEQRTDDENLCKSTCLEMGLSSFKDKVIGVLKSSGFEDKRPSKLSIEQLLHLLSLFNKNGVYFHHHLEEAGSLELGDIDSPSVKCL